MVFTFSGRENSQFVWLVCAHNSLWAQLPHLQKHITKCNWGEMELWCCDREENFLILFYESELAHPELWSGRFLRWESRRSPPAVSSFAPHSAWTPSATWSLLPAEQERKDAAAVTATAREIHHSGHAYLGDAELAGRQLRLHLVHLLAAVAHGALQLLAAFDHGLHLWLHLADVKTSHCELFINQAAALLLLLH